MTKLKIKFSEIYNPKPRQLLFHQTKKPFVLFGGALGGGKSWAICADGLITALKYPGARVGIFRKNVSTAKRTTILTWEEILKSSPELIRKENKQEKKWEFVNGSIVWFLPADQSKDPEFDKIRSLELTSAYIDEAQEITYDYFKQICTRVGRKVHADWIKKGYVPQVKLSANPSPNWVYRTFIAKTAQQSDQERADYEFIQSLTRDNYDENSQYYQMLLKTFGGNKTLIDRYIEGMWEFGHEDDDLFRYDQIHACRPDLDNPAGRFVVGVDVAGEGGDETVIVLMRGQQIFGIYRYKTEEEKDFGFVAEEIALLKFKYGISDKDIAVDSTGLGIGLTQELKRRWNIKCRAVNFGSKATVKNPVYQLRNMRSQMHFELWESVKDGELFGLSDQMLIEEMNNVKYEILADRTFAIEDKSILKKRIGRSPDTLDALILANHALKNRKKGTLTAESV